MHTKTEQFTPCTTNESLTRSEEHGEDTSDMTEDFLSLQKIIVGIATLPESQEVQRQSRPQALRQAIIDQLLDTTESLEASLVTKINEVFLFYRDRVEYAQLLHGDDIIDIRALVTHKSDGEGIGEQYFMETVTSPNARFPETSYSVDLYEENPSRVVLRHSGLRGDEKSPGCHIDMKIYDGTRDGMVEVKDASRQRQILTGFLRELLISAELQLKRDIRSQEWYDRDAKRLLTEESALFARPTSLE